MIFDQYQKMKTDLYCTEPDLLICPSADEAFPYRLIFWHTEIDYAEAQRRIREHGVKGKNYRVWRNPSIDGNGAVSVIETDDIHAETTLGTGLVSTRFRVITPKQAENDEAEKRLVFPWRIMCRTRPPAPNLIREIMGRRGTIAYHSGYDPNGMRWAPDNSLLGTVYAIHVRDETTALMLQIAIGDSTME